MEKVRTFLFNEISLIIAVAGVIMGAYLMLSSPTAANTLNIELLKKDVLKITNVEDDIKEIKEKQIEMDKKLDRAVFILEEAVQNEP